MKLKLDFDLRTLSDRALTLLLKGAGRGGSGGRSLYPQLLRELECRRLGLQTGERLEVELGPDVDLALLVRQFRHDIVALELAASILPQGPDREDLQSAAAFTFSIVDSIFRLSCPARPA